ncbi:MAG: hypothetical protein JSU86_04940 [Phycisphaerales bacterium]|nr:MAG: hypothetical protein JSU86_04940 [Phycisphaerales bacterium]
MIRKIVIIVLTLAATSTASLWLAGFSLRAPFDFLPATNRVHLVRVGIVFGNMHVLIYTPAREEPRYGSSHSRILGFEFYWTEHYDHFSFRDKGGTDGTWTNVRGMCFRLPGWLLALLLAAYPAASAIPTLRRRRRRRKGLCVSCAYDLTGNVSGVCPECGAKIEQL